MSKESESDDTNHQPQPNKATLRDKIFRTLSFFIGLVFIVVNVTVLINPLFESYEQLFSNISGIGLGLYFVFFSFTGKQIKFSHIYDPKK